MDDKGGEGVDFLVPVGVFVLAMALYFVSNLDHGRLTVCVATGAPILVGAKETAGVPAVVFQGGINFFNKFFNGQVNPGGDFSLLLVSD